MRQINDKQTLAALKKVETFTSKIAGINYRIKPTNTNYGFVVGYAVADPQNEYDPNAIALYRRNDGKHIGYIPKDDLEDYRDFAKGNAGTLQRTNFIGMVYPFLNDEDKPALASEITFINDDNKDEDYQLVKQQYEQWYREDANKEIANFNHRLKNQQEFNSLKHKDNQSTYETTDNNNGGCLTGIVIAVILTLATLL